MVHPSFSATQPHNEALLCSICANLDFYQIFLNGIPETEDIPLDNLSSILRKSYQCNFCRLISFHVRRMWMLDQFPPIDISGIECRMFTKGCGCLQLASYPPSKFRHLEEIPSFRIAGALNIHLMQEDTFKFGRPTDLHCRRVKNTVDINMVKKWIKLCHASHGDICKSLSRIGEHDKRKLPGFVRVVDVVLMAVVPAPSGCCYVALSYIWGGIGAEYWTTKDKLAERGKPGGLSTAKLPDTITDSILFVRQLGERYIWIDALCIIQDDSQDKFAQIHDMDLVYGLSYLTIIAAGGTTAQDPLPGCRPQTRTPQHIEVIQGLHLYAAPPRLKEALALSAWNTRCWTYQECALSRRRIYFTGHQVYFECQFDVLCEDVIAESKCDSTNFLKDSRAEYFPHYMMAVKQCARRNLTVESDIIDALTGVTNALAKAFGLGDPDRAFRYGIMLTDLHHALLWQHNPHTPRTRRSLPDGCSLPWPSWAWATWCGAVDYMSEHRYLPSVVEMFVDPWYIVDRSGIILQLDVRRGSRRVVLIRETEGEGSTGDVVKNPIHLFITGLFDILSASSPPTWVDVALPTSLEFIVLSHTGILGAYDEERIEYYQECLPTCDGG
ncbi:heterokaryon incompatibility protein-domain-containing protein [Suillus discolor]|uniref:Heterokaryon incompatibility protein-domain-containing protein n=1 Tax=Suillus discolor TaxID=1912936 RepID=A0A9P7F9S7_9AGAM|nr:heterokaryon incompatibility protein-domain-containing protein [Suillus discolor]KAG2109684.1 heterokaryon incompatibility protein-domain-containing protein [Suillus discolor]